MVLTARCVHSIESDGVQSDHAIERASDFEWTRRGQELRHEPVRATRRRHQDRLGPSRAGGRRRERHEAIRGQSDWDGQTSPDP